MAFIDELGSKIISAGQKTTKAISDMSQVSKLKDSINAEQVKINQLYATMGKVYFERYGAVASEDPFRSICGNIREGQARIARIEEEIRQVQNAKTCPQCGAVCGYDSMFCQGCGFSFQKAQYASKDSFRFCSNCGVSLAEDAAFCVGCGQPIASVQPVAPAAQFAGASVPPTTAPINHDIAPGAQSVAPVFVCPNCGVGLPEDAAFCIECGQAVEMVGSPVVAIEPPVNAVRELEIEVESPSAVSETETVIVADSESAAADSGSDTAVDIEPVAVDIEPAAVDIEPVAEETTPAQQEVKPEPEAFEPTINIKAHYYDYANTVVIPSKKKGRKSVSEQSQVETQESEVSDADGTGLHDSVTTAPEAAPDVVPVTTLEPEKTLACKNCGAELVADAGFCIECGTPVDA